MRIAYGRYIRGALTAVVVGGLSLAPAFAGVGQAAMVGVAGGRAVGVRSTLPLAGSVHRLPQGMRVGVPTRPGMMINAAPAGSIVVSSGAFGVSRMAPRALPTLPNTGSISGTVSPSAMQGATVAAAATPQFDVEASLSQLQQTLEMPLPPPAVTVPLGEIEQLQETVALPPTAVTIPLGELQTAEIGGLPPGVITSLPRLTTIQLTPEQFVGLPEQAPIVLPPGATVSTLELAPLPPSGVFTPPQITLVPVLPNVTGIQEGPLQMLPSSP